VIALLLAYAADRLGITVDRVGPFVSVPAEVVEQLRARPGRSLRARFEVVEAVEAERTVFMVETETAVEVV